MATGNDFDFLHENEEFFVRMLEAIDRANRYVLLEMYLVTSSLIATRFLEAMVRARLRGVRVCALLDGFGALGLTRADRRRLLGAGVELRFYNPLGLGKGFANLLRDHRKLLLSMGYWLTSGERGSRRNLSRREGAAHGASSWWRSAGRWCVTGSTRSRAAGGAAARRSGLLTRRRACQIRTVPRGACR